MATAEVASTRRRRPRPVRTAVGTLAALALLAGCASGARTAAVPTVPEPDESVVQKLEHAPEPLTGEGADADAAAPPADEAPPRGETSEVGALVEGFPADLIPIPEDAVILVTSAVPVGDSDVREVSLNVRTSASTAALARLYRDALTATGFTEVESVEPTGAVTVQLTFVRSAGDELVSIGVVDVDGGRTVTIGGRVRDAG